MEDARAMARSSKAGRVARLLGANNSSASVMASEGADGTPVSGGVSGVSNGTTPSGRSAKGRLDKPRRARGGRVKGKTNVTVIVAPQGGQGGADPLSAAMGAKMGALSTGAAGGPQTGAPMPPSAMPAAAPASPPQQPQQRPPMAGQPVPMRKRGGSVKAKRMVDGAGSGLGRIADASAEKAFLRAKGGAAKKGPCWSGYHAEGMKKMGKRTVPDCRPS